MKRNSRFLAIAACALAIMVAASSVVFGAGAAETGSFSVDAPSAFLMDAATGTTLYEQNAREHCPVASMVKIMTLVLAFDAVDAGELGLDESITVSENASSMGGSQAFLDAHAEYKADDLIKAIIVASANDACVAIAERLGGSVDAFVGDMNDRAAELGMNDTNFVNCTGLPAPNQYSCAADAAVMFRELIGHDKYFEYSGIWMFDFEHPSGRKTMLTNTNKLIRSYEGCDGGKTGFTNEAMYCLSATAERNGTRLISVVTGAQTSKGRNAQICKLFDYGFANYETRQVIFGGVELDAALEIPASKEKRSAVVPAENGFYLAARGSSAELTYEIAFDENISLPVAAGSTVGKLSVFVDGELVASSPLVTSTELTVPGYLDILGELLRSW